MTQQSVSDTPAGAAPRTERIALISARVNAACDDVKDGFQFTGQQVADLCEDICWLIEQVSAVDALREDAARLDFITEQQGQWSLHFVALRGKWACEGPDDANLDERYPDPRSAIDAARHTHTVRSAAEVIDPKTGKKVMDLMEALKASLNFDKSRAGSLSGRNA